ncbi:hypothetical protein E3N88_29346 [Mikania micrantha]|uniref:Uncharacterized protein n=1 Tax=Mikania micrantha TaxID=192012 RepID=A0A5N6MIZ4_9ASTR|nr:hypothetical protein E3N88_29346 [Mikania micrantha]
MCMTVEDAKKLNRFFCSDCSFDDDAKRPSNSFPVSPSLEVKCRLEYLDPLLGLVTGCSQRTGSSTPYIQVKDNLNQYLFQLATVCLLLSQLKLLKEHADIICRSPLGRTDRLRGQPSDTIMRMKKIAKWSFCEGEADRKGCHVNGRGLADRSGSIRMKNWPTEGDAERMDGSFGLEAIRPRTSSYGLQAFRPI